MIRPIGNRVFVRPVHETRSPITLTDEQPPQLGDVVAIGTPHCKTCEDALDLSLSVGMRIAMRPTAIVQDFTVDGETLWMVQAADVIGEVLPIEEPTHA